METFSHSKIETFRQCPFKYKCKYIDKIKTEITNTIEAFMGSRVHDALEKLYKDLHFQKENSLNDLLKFYNDEWEKLFEDGILIVRKEYSIEHYKKLGEKCITDYYNRFKPFDQDKTISTEEYIKYQLDEEGEIFLQGYIDRLSCDDKGNYVIRDYKTANSLKSDEDANNDRQLALYAIAVKEKYQDVKSLKLVWHMLAFDKDVEVSKTDEELSQLKKDTLSFINEILHATEFPANQSALCSWCEFRSLCPHFKHIAKIENSLENEYLFDDGVQLSKKYFELKEKQDKIETEVNKLRDAIIEYGEKENITTISDGSGKIRIWSKDCKKLPDKKSPLHYKLIEVLKGLEIYDENLSLNLWDLEKKLEGKQYPPHILEALEKFITEKKIQRLYPSK